MSDSDEDQDALKQRMINKMLKEAESDDSDSDGSGSNANDSDSDGETGEREVKMNFDDSAKNQKKEKKQKKGILGLKFMERA